MGRFCACFGKLASCFCFSSKEKSSGDGEMLPVSGESVPGSPELPISNRITTNLPNNKNIVSRNDPLQHKCEEQRVEWTSGIRKETVVIHWKLQDFPALCEMKDLLKNETCTFTAGRTLNMPSRWCYNLQRMKNEEHVGLFLKRLPPVSLADAIGKSPGVPALTNGATKFNHGVVALANNDQASVGGNNGHEATDPVFIHYECIIKRSGHGERWLAKQTCISNFEVGQRLGFRKLFTMDELKNSDEGIKAKTPPLLSEDDTLHLEITFVLHLKSAERTQSETNLKDALSLDLAQKQHHAELLRSDLKTLFANGLNADLILLIEGEGEFEEHEFLVHKGILAARSPVFAAMFQSGMKETGSRILRIKDVTPQAMHSVLSYIYSGTTDETTNWSNVREVQDLIYAADKYSLIGLRDFCDKMMFSGVEFGNAMELLYLAQMHSMPVAVKKISQFIKMNASEILTG